MIDREKAIEQLSQIKVKGNSDGLIPSFNVLVNFLPSYFWNSFSEKLLKQAGEDDKLYADIEEGLELAAAECGYHTGYGIITSEEFKSIVGPMIENEPEDILHGAFAVFTAWGWADAEITSLSREKMVVHVKDYYESDIRDTFAVKRPFGYMIRGVSRAFMDLGYGKPYPDGLGAHVCRQTRAIELGDEYGEFVVTQRA
ncbi:MAG: hypothetical protein K9L68_10705 [Spirochaetales bacterium]|nr:hypothetical protein [Spirochaetales bacterium]MCF7939054.1 hypothetical protein [Spirochaetales bacterium]